MDLDKAEAGGCHADEIAELRGNVQIVAAEARRRQQSRYDRLHVAKRRIEGGSLAAGRKILDQAPDQDPDAAQLRKVANERADQAGDMASEIEALLAQSQYAAAAGRLRKLKKVYAHAEIAIKLEKRLCDEAIENARTALTDGKLKRAADELACLDSLGKNLPARRELTDMIAIAGQAAAALQTHDYAAARRHAMSLERLLPGAAWVRDAIEQLRQLAELHTALIAGPMGADARALATVAAPAPLSPPFAKPVDPDETVVRPSPVVPSPALTPTALPTRLLLLVDGGGSYLMIRDGRASIGRAAATNPADIPLFSAISSRHANIERVDDDFFLFSAKDVEVAGRKVTNHLLRSGDRIVLGKSAKLTYRVPSRKSPSAVLDLSDTTKMPNDVRRVVLFHQHAIVGEGPHVQIQCRHARPPLVLFERKGELWIRQRSDGRNDNSAQPLKLGDSIEVGGARISLEPWRVRPPGLSAV